MNQASILQTFATKPLFLAPMEGITNNIFRRQIIDLGGVDVVATEFIRITSEKQKIRDFNRYRVPLQIQVMGSTAEVISGCVTFMKERTTLQDSDWLDLNVGCPSKRVNSHGAGSALLLDPQKLVGIIKALRLVHDGPLSIKTRLGFQSSEQFPEILEALKDCPLDFITIHARSRAGSYAEKVDYNFFNLAARTLPYPVIGNGDINDVKTAKEVLATGVSGIMCGRSATSNPYLFNQIKNYLLGKPDFEVTRELLLNFADKLIDAYLQHESVSDKRYIGVFKEFSVWLSKNQLIGREFFQIVKQKQNLSEIKTEILRF